jgi:DNA end-binding protein Ku
MDLARKLIETLAAPFDPEKFHDEYKENVEKLIESKRAGKKIQAVKQPRKAPVIDLMQALQQSLAGVSSGAKHARARKTSTKKVSRKGSVRAA